MSTEVNETGRLVGRDFWDVRHGHHTREQAHGKPPRLRIRRYLDLVRTRVGAQSSETYSQYLARKVFAAHLPVREDWLCLEVGCAPGRNLVRFNRLFGYRPWGVEYSPAGAQNARDTLVSSGFDPSTIIEADFFDQKFHRDYAGRFNVVLSLGFIEHFDDPACVVREHVDLIAPGGFLVCAIPNLRGWGYPFLALYARDLLSAHNCEIMRLRPFQRLFEGTELEERFCGYVGTWGVFGMSLRHERSFRGYLACAIDRANDLLSHAAFLFLRGRAAESAWSPGLLYIGQRSACPATPATRERGAAPSFRRGPERVPQGETP